MEKLKLNPNNKKYYSEEFTKGFECGVERQFQADMSKINKGESMTNFEYIMSKEKSTDREKYPLFFAVCSMHKRCSNCLIPKDMDCANGIAEIEQWLKEEKKGIVE